MAVSWHRKNSIINLPQRSIDLVRQYNSNWQQELSEKAILERAQAIAQKAADNNGQAEYRCLETGGFLLPTVCFHPWYDQLRHKNRQKLGAVLELGCGLGADGRQLLVDGIATHVVGVDRSDLYLRLGCELFGDECDKACVHNIDGGDDPLPTAVFFKADIADQGVGDEDFVGALQGILSRQQQQGAVDSSRNQNEPVSYFQAVYAGKFLHCLETEANLRIVLRRIWKAMAHQGSFFGVFGRNYKPVFECASREDFTRVLKEEGFVVELVVEEKAGATWFGAKKQHRPCRVEG